MDSGRRGLLISHGPVSRQRPEALKRLDSPFVRRAGFADGETAEWKSIRNPASGDQEPEATRSSKPGALSQPAEEGTLGSLLSLKVWEFVFHAPHLQAHLNST